MPAADEACSVIANRRETGLILMGGGAHAAYQVGVLPRPIRSILRMTGATERRSAGLLSYLLFEPVYLERLIALGRADALAQSTGVVAPAEIGDKTQLLALMLAVRFRRPGPIIAGILLATLANHALAGGLGAWVHQVVDPGLLRWVVGLSFAAMALWTLVPDRLDDDAVKTRRLGAFGATLIAFFLVEMGDKTQVATVALAAQYSSFVSVVAGTTLGMMIANAPIVLFGERIAAWIPVRAIQLAAAGLFLLLGVLVLLGVGMDRPAG